MNRPLIPVVAALLAAASIFADDAKFSADVAEAMARFKGAMASAEKLVQQGKLEEANKAYLDVRVDPDLTPADCFLLGNVFFKIAPDLSAKYQKRAYDAFPENPEVNLEWAMTLHRQGKPKEAADCYLKSIAKYPDRYLAHALLADCLIRNGDLKGAVEHWNKAGHPQNHTGIDFAICEIYGPLSPHLRHYHLIKAVAGGETARVEEMVDLALNWEQDWWNSTRNEAALNRSLDVATKALSGDPGRLAELQLYVDTFDERNTGSPKWLREKLAAMKLLVGADGALPGNNIVADRLCSLVLKQKLATKKELLERIGDKLRERSMKAVLGDIMSLNLLAFLLLPDNENVANDEKLTEVNRLGWERYHDSRFAASYLAGALRRNELKTRSPILEKALKEFPEDPWICAIAMKVAQAEGAAIEPYLAPAIKAEFRHLSGGMGGFKDSYTLKSLFATLEQTLK
jgi:tetratricopeptide (TPR) repeat protein